ncbi:SEC-C metal-binding domain-containing protein [Kistimonas scapharcae]|uniref:SEC-C metal-binding domain-containing protein n=1 Tax=Kistimonas scapharcae TaxID=1036133 RepID=UPI0031EE8AE0
MSYLKAPLRIDNAIEQFCSEISDEKPVYLELEAEPYCVPLECFPNVDLKIKKDGGTKVYGWQIWIWEDVFVEAEFHSVWKSDDGTLKDITPKTDSTKRILFLPDSKIVYEGKQVDNIRKPLSKNPLIRDYINTHKARFSLQNFGDRAYKHELTLEGEEYEIFRWLLTWQTTLQNMLGDNLTKNSRCPCGSGNKFKSCCRENLTSGLQELESKYSFTGL